MEVPTVFMTDKCEIQDGCWKGNQGPAWINERLRNAVAKKDWGALMIDCNF
jgi:hypothetical protein